MARILMVDDNPSTRSLLRIALISRRHDVLTAANGWEAIEQAQRHQPDLILMDLMMPVMDGESAAMVLKKALETQTVDRMLETQMVPCFEPDF